MADQSISCPDCGKTIPLTRAIRAEIETSLKRQFDDDLAARERQLQAAYAERLDADLARAQKDAVKKAEKKVSQDLELLKEQVKEQGRELEDARKLELAMRKRERELERKQQDLEVTVARRIDAERAAVVAQTRETVAEQHRLKDAEKERQLGDMRRQIEDLKRKAEQGSQQLQGEAGEEQLESVLCGAFPADDIRPVSQGIRGADLEQIVVDTRGLKCGVILWECKNTRNWSDGWIAKLKQDQRALRSDVAVLVSAVLPRGLTRFGWVDGVLVCDFASAAALASVLRVGLQQVAQARSSAVNKDEKLELLHRYLSGVAFRQRVEAMVDAFAAMRQDLDQERRAAERQWSKRARQIDSVTFSIAGMYGDLQGLVPALPSIALLELPSGDDESVTM
jgi:hypothetical protein